MISTACEKTGFEEIAAEYAEWQGGMLVSDSNSGSDDNATADSKPTTQGTVIEDGIVDLGLSVKWAAKNLSKSTSDHFATYCINFGSEFSWYASNDYLPPTEIGGSDLDNATVLLGEGWQTPSVEQVKELQERCLIQQTTYRGTSGVVITGPSGNAIFLPAARNQGDINVEYYNSCYWTSSYNLSKGEGYYMSVPYSASGTFSCSKSASTTTTLLIRPVYVGI